MGHSARDSASISARKLLRGVSAREKGVISARKLFLGRSARDSASISARKAFFKCFFNEEISFFKNCFF